MLPLGSTLESFGGQSSRFSKERRKKQKVCRRHGAAPKLCGGRTARHSPPRVMTESALNVPGTVEPWPRPGLALAPPKHRNLPNAARGINLPPPTRFTNYFFPPPNSGQAGQATMSRSTATVVLPFIECAPLVCSNWFTLKKE